jgi:hypothetical protein
MRSPSCSNAPTSSILSEQADRLVSIERGYQLGIARSIARIYADVLNEPVPADIARLVARLDPGQEASKPDPKDRVSI